MIKTGDDVGEILLESIDRRGIELEDGDVLVIAQTIISKAEGNIVELDSVEPGPQAEEIAEEIDEDPRKAEVMLRQTEEVVRLGDALITQTKHGFICANAGVDSSNVGPGKVTTLPEDPDKSARRIRRKIRGERKRDVAVIISDSWGRPFRLGAVGHAVGVAGMKALIELRGDRDIYEKRLETTTIAPPDSLAAMASLEMGEGAEKIPAVLIRGYSYESGDEPIGKLLRPSEDDLFR